MTNLARSQSDQAPRPSLGELIKRSADLKRQLADYVQGPCCARHLAAALLEAESDHGLDDAGVISVIDRFALQHRLPDGRTPVERFTASCPDLSAIEQEMLLGWQDAVEGAFEIQAKDGDAVRLLNLLDDFEYQTYSNVGRKAFRSMAKGDFIIGRLVPIAPHPGCWLVSGSLAYCRKSDSPRIAQIALQMATKHPELVFRNPEKIAQGWEQMHREREAFVTYFGSDQVVLPPSEAENRISAFHQHLWQTTRAEAGKHDPTEPFPQQLSFQLPEYLADADTVGIVYDSVEGMNLYRNWGLLDALFTAPTLAASQRHADLLRSYVRDTSISPLPFQRMAAAHPTTVDTVISKVLRKPGFSWAQHGEAWLRRRKADYFEREPRPNVSVIGDRLAELAATSRF
ncbi:hypothetical protein ACFVFQ_37300 [Streptomyces sp. NPDC057743]|uniref:hypothetical protein n=1 Tax=Streptomyces sp. NPDC057743 TaxID=3346236 RepID=UPI0036C36479